MPTYFSIPKPGLKADLAVLLDDDWIFVRLVFGTAIACSSVLVFFAVVGGAIQMGVS